MSDENSNAPGETPGEGEQGSEQAAEKALLERLEAIEGRYEKLKDDFVTFRRKSRDGSADATNAKSGEPKPDEGGKPKSAEVATMTPLQLKAFMRATEGLSDEAMSALEGLPMDQALKFAELLRSKAPETGVKPDPVTGVTPSPQKAGRPSPRTMTELQTLKRKDPDAYERLVSSPGFSWDAISRA